MGRNKTLKKKIDNLTTGHENRGLGFENFRVGLGYESNQPELLG